MYGYTLRGKGESENSARTREISLPSSIRGAVRGFVDRRETRSLSAREPIRMGIGRGEWETGQSEANADRDAVK